MMGDKIARIFQVSNSFFSFVRRTCQDQRMLAQKSRLIKVPTCFLSKVYAPSLYITDDDNVAIFPGSSGHFSCLDLRPRGHYEVHGDDIALPVAEQTPPLSGQNRFQFHRPAQPTAALGSPAQAIAPTPPRASMSNTFQRYPQSHQFRAPLPLISKLFASQII